MLSWGLIGLVSATELGKLGLPWVTQTRKFHDFVCRTSFFWTPHCQGSKSASIRAGLSIQGAQGAVSAFFVPLAGLGSGCGSRFQ